MTDEASILRSSNFVAIPVAMIGSVVAVLWWIFSLRADLDNLKNTMEAQRTAEARGRLWERLAEHGKSIAGLEKDIAVLQERTKR